ncbi:hypothetical protein CC1G_02788 [Coprinopsis cinerea okayama7|uniref:F-box domain-containing protein n=1 Tax=Coprinopsis cinerea (strain Okayama-7 / 130 / ATCC MYA-4618 / FGSC 9003) TaxID=240176 RepID=A8N018_COPC7|nr:hypothetical protein CC1G_02788 [Coprinopsis cinerea okayama7\|eukprot:XP_001828207.2 hypothetical protein CC1G_02788 [Coprinopsis cinerea okayama7\
MALLQRRLQALLDILDGNPGIAHFVRRLHLAFDDIPALNANAHLLLDLVQRFDGIRTLDIALNARNRDIGNLEGNWDDTPLNTHAEASIRHLCALPTLTKLAISGGKLPFDIFIHNAHLQSLNLFQIHERSKVETDSIEPCDASTRAARKYPALKALTFDVDDDFWIHDGSPLLYKLVHHHPQLFRHLTTLNLPFFVSLDNLKEILSLTTETLTDLLYSSVLPAKPNQAMVDFSNMKNLRSIFLLYKPDRSVPFASYHPHIMSSVSTIPWRQMESATFFLHSNCVVRRHPKTHLERNPTAHFQAFDSMLAPYTVTNGGRLSHVDLMLAQERCLDRCWQHGRMEPYVVESFVPQLYEQAVSDSRLKLRCNFHASLLTIEWLMGLHRANQRGDTIGGAGQASTGIQGRDLHALSTSLWNSRKPFTSTSGSPSAPELGTNGVIKTTLAT